MTKGIDVKVIKKNIEIDNRFYSIEILRKMSQNTNAPRLVIVSYLPNETACKILKSCLDSIKKYTSEPHELWVVDNCSPKELKLWLLEYPDLNIIWNNNKYIDDGSYDNGIALEIIKDVIDPNSKFLMTLHMDTMVCKENWLNYLLSKFNEDVRAVGVRIDRSRVSDGVLHCLGAIYDFQLIRKFDLSFMPQLPDFDVGDLITVNIKKANYKIFHCKNTFNDPKLIKNISKDSPFLNITVDRTLDDNCDIFFIHLGRGIVKSQGLYQIEGKTTPHKWINFGKYFILSDSIIPNRFSYNIVSPKFSDISYSIRRYFVDEFFFRKIRKFKKNQIFLDIGGKKMSKRGQFNINSFPLIVKYANIDPNTEPDYLCDASNIPVENDYFDGVICAEVLEHVKNPIEILEESFRVLKPKGEIFVTIPFHFRIHTDPADYARYTDTYLRELFKQVGFINITIEKQGGFSCVLFDMIRSWIYIMKIERKKRILCNILSIIMSFAKKRVIEIDVQEDNKYNELFTSYTTGYGIVAIKPMIEMNANKKGF